MAWAKGLDPFNIVTIIFFVRFLSVYVVQTWYVPDEYWQSLEVAHKYVFGYGALTWEWQKGIRSYLFPSVLSVFYTELKVTSLDYPELVVIIPRILQSILSIIGDFYFYRWTGNRKWALFLILTSWFWFYTSSRTLLQTSETAFVMIALSLFPFKAGKLGYYEKESNQWIWLACLTLFVRPTSAPIWAVLGVYNFMSTNQGRWKLLLRAVLPIALIVTGGLVALDSYFHGSFVVTPYEFFKHNVVNDIASFYGQHPWHWYISQGIPAILGVHLPLVLWGLYKTLKRPNENKIGLVLIIAAAVHILVHSLIPHKEFRFMLPLLPIFLYLAQDVIVPWSRKARKWQLYTLATALILGNAAPSVYFGVVHQSGTMQAMPLLRDAITSNQSSILFMMPCHSTPLYSHLHVNVTTRYLNCDPPKPGVTYESETFFNNPERWWRSEYAARATPSLLLMFDTLRGRVEPLLRGYQLLHELPHTQFPQGEVGEKVLIYKKTENRPRAPTDEVV